MAALKKVKCHPDLVEYFKELPFYNKHVKKPKINLLKTLICFLNTFAFLLPNNTKSYVKKYKTNGEIEFRSVYFN